MTNTFEWQDIWRGVSKERNPDLGDDEEDGLTDGAQAILILAFKLFSAAERGLCDPPLPVPDADLIPAFHESIMPYGIPEDYVNRHFYPTIL